MTKKKKSTKPKTYFTVTYREPSSVTINAIDIHDVDTDSQAIIKATNKLGKIRVIKVDRNDPVTT